MNECIPVRVTNSLNQSTTLQNNISVNKMTPVAYITRMILHPTVTSFKFIRKT